MVQSLKVERSPVNAGGPPAANSPIGKSELSAAIIGTNTAAFALSFALWVVFGPSIRVIAQEMHISLATATLIKTLPVLVGSALRIPVGILTDRLGSRIMFSMLMLVSAGAVYGLSTAQNATQLLVGGIAMGLVGTTFVVGVQSVSSWTPKEKRGLALGIFGAGNVGTAITTLGFPVLLQSLGWRGSFRVYALVMAVAAAGYWLLVRDALRQGPPLQLAALLAPLKSARTWRFGLYYMATFGVFVAATLTIGDIYIDAYGMPIKTAGLLATTFACAASLSRVPGGGLADRFGARRMVQLSLIAAICSLTPVCFGVPLVAAVSLVFASGIALGFGMAAVFRYIPDYFPESVGAVGGVVGALGGLGGFFLPQVGAWMKSVFNSPYAQVIPLSAVAIVAVVVQHWAARRVPEDTGDGSLAALASAVSGDSQRETNPASH